MSSQYDLEAVMPMVRPQCFSTTSPLHKLVPSDTEGWEEWAWKEKVRLSPFVDYSGVTPEEPGT
jgi:hypothetical protein